MHPTIPQPRGWRATLLLLCLAACTAPRSHLSLRDVARPTPSFFDGAPEAPPAAPVENVLALPDAPLAALPVEPPAAAALEVVCTYAAKGNEPPGLSRVDQHGSGEVVLTFDDGPYPDKTPRVLDLLAQHHFQATFFVLGRHIDRTTYALIQRMEADGHAIGSHSYDHDLVMAQRAGTVEYIQGQHETTRILIELALLAESGDDFDALFERVFERAPGSRLSEKALRAEWRAFRARHDAVLAERGVPGGRYPVTLSRPPGGGPYLGKAAVPRARYTEALAALGMLNVMWHGEAGDVDASRPTDRMFLVGNIVRRARRGGVLLIHDFIRFDALAAAFDQIAADSAVHVLDLRAAIDRKYGCSPATRPGSA